VIIYIGMAFAYGDQYIPMDSLKDGVWVTEKEIGDKLGIQTGDKILAVDGDKIEKFDMVFMELINGNHMTLERNGQIIEKEILIDFIATLLEDEENMRFMTIRAPFLVNQVAYTSHNRVVPIRIGEEILMINGCPANYMHQLLSLLEQNKGKQIDILVQHGDGSRENLRAQVDGEGKLGVELGALSLEKLEEKGAFRMETQKYSFLEAIPAGINKGVTTLGSYVKQLKKIFNPETGAYKGVGGFGAIGSLFPDTWNWPAFWSTTAFISIILAFMNILPIPALDGGHVMFLLYEMVSGRKPSDKFLEYAQMVGFFLLIALLLFANGNDVYKWLFK